MLMIVTRKTALRKLETLTGRLTAVAAQRDAGSGDGGWLHVGGDRRRARLGVSAQAAHRRFRWLRHSPVTGEVWQEPPLALATVRPKDR